MSVELCAVCDTHHNAYMPCDTAAKLRKAPALDAVALMSDLYRMSQAAHAAYSVATDAAEADGVSILDSVPCRHLSALCDALGVTIALAEMVRTDNADDSRA